MNDADIFGCTNCTCVLGYHLKDTYILSCLCLKKTSCNKNNVFQIMWFQQLNPLDSLAFELGASQFKLNCRLNSKFLHSYSLNNRKGLFRVQITRWFFLFQRRVVAWYWNQINSCLLGLCKLYF